MEPLYIDDGCADHFPPPTTFKTTRRGPCRCGSERVSIRERERAISGVVFRAIDVSQATTLRARIGTQHHQKNLENNAD